MSTQRYPLQLADIARADFRTSVNADNENTRLQKTFGFQFRYQPARLAIGISLSDPKPPCLLQELGGKPIRGDTLFGQDEIDIGMWTALVVQHSNEIDMPRRAFQELIGAHWERGIEILSHRAESADNRVEDLIDSLLRNAGAAA